MDDAWVIEHRRQPRPFSPETYFLVSILCIPVWIVCWLVYRWTRRAEARNLRPCLGSRWRKYPAVGMTNAALKLRTVGYRSVAPGDALVEYAIGIAIGIVIGLIAGYFVAKSVLAGQFGGQAGLDLGKKVAARAGTDPAFAKRLDELFNPPPPRPNPEPVRLLGLLQREARLLDFLMENLSAYDDQQIGASVRDIQAKSQGVIKKHLTLEPVLGQEEGARGDGPGGLRPVGHSPRGQRERPAAVPRDPATRRLAGSGRRLAPAGRGPGRVCTDARRGRVGLDRPMRPISPIGRFRPVVPSPYERTCDPSG